MKVIQYDDNIQCNVTLQEITDGDCPQPLGSMIAGYIEHGIFYTSSSVVRHFYQLYHEHLAAKKIESADEKKFRDQIAQKLKCAGWQVAIEQYTSQGQIDILAVQGKDTRIIEVKLFAGSNDMAHALGQLLFYRKFYPCATLWVAVPNSPDETILSILASYGVCYLEAPCI